MKKKALSNCYIGSFLAICLTLFACQPPAKPKVIVNVKNTIGTPVTGAWVYIYPDATYLNPDIATPADTADQNFMNGLTTNTQNQLLLDSDPTLLDSALSDAQGKVTFEKDFPMILNVLAIKDTLSGNGMANFIEDEVTNVQVTIN